jgi:tRNA(Ile)-lysidine synthetase-like protein
VKTLEDFLCEGLPAFTKEYSGIMLSCSGGTDSTALFHLLHRNVKFREEFPLVLLHFNFGLRGEESDRDQDFVESLGREHGVRVIVRKIEQGERDLRTEKNIQAWARAIRQETFKEFAKNRWIIALAHQKEDLAETILLRMIRGVSPGSLLGMEEWNPPHWRPLLDISRAEIIAWLNKNGLSFRQDSSNQKKDYSRNFVRHQVLKDLGHLNKKAVDHIIRFAQETQDFVKFTRASLLNTGEFYRNLPLDSKTLKNLPKGVAYDVLSCRIGRPETRGINHRILEQALSSRDAASTGGGGRSLVQLPKGRSLVECKGAISVVKAAPFGRKKPRLSQHEAAISSGEGAIFLGPSAIVDFFPIPAGTVLDQKFQVYNSDLIVKKFSRL